MSADPRPSNPFTLRAFLIGSVLSVFLAFACPYTVFLHHTAGMAADFITAGAVFLFFLFTFLVNAVLRLVHRALALDGPELILVYTMMIVASAIPTWGLMANLLPVLPGAYYYATPENDWAGIIHPFLPDWVAPQQPLAVQYFYEGLPAGKAIPWGQWAEPLACWAVLILSVYAFMISSMVIIRRQWVEHERLVFPLTQLPLEMIKRSGPRAIFPICSDRLCCGSGSPSPSSSSAPTACTATSTSSRPWTSRSVSSCSRRPRCVCSSVSR